MDQASNSEKMEKEASRRRLSRKKSSVSASRSFKLRSESLNSLRLRRVFDLFDKNKDGLITVDEIKQALVLLGLDEDKEDDHNNDDIELHSIVTSFIKPGYHGLAFDDFESLHNSLHTTFFFDCHDHNDHFQDVTHHQQDQVESDLNEAFKVFDSDGDGYISATELQQVLSKLGFPEAQQELHHIQHMISSFDDNHDGRVDFFEFKHMMSRTLLLPSA
uniref:EF-hand domain-containing protein n=2 Tax=Chenopodium quinoa TaxID=63459 RepID=A0A803MI69_CHEQI